MVDCDILKYQLIYLFQQPKLKLSTFLNKFFIVVKKYFIIIMLVNKALKYLSDLIKRLPVFNKKIVNVSPYVYRPTPWLFNHAIQSIYELYSQDIIAEYEREKIFFADGGHVCLDWVNKF